MIAFCCDACGKQFKLGPEFAGRSTTCTGCKTPLTVPLPDKGILAAPPSPRIAFSCVACGMKFNVKPEFAGRSTQCPTCKKPLVVPGIPAPIASDPTVGQIDGAPSSLARVHSSEGAPLVQHPSASSTGADLLRGKLDDAPPVYHREGTRPRRHGRRHVRPYRREMDTLVWINNLASAKFWAAWDLKNKK